MKIRDHEFEYCTYPTYRDLLPGMIFELSGGIYMRIDNNRNEETMKVLLLYRPGSKCICAIFNIFADTKVKVLGEANISW